MHRTFNKREWEFSESMILPRFITDLRILQLRFRHRQAMLACRHDLFPGDPAGAAVSPAAKDWGNPSPRNLTGGIKLTPEIQTERNAFIRWNVTNWQQSLMKRATPCLDKERKRGGMQAPLRDLLDQGWVFVHRVPITSPGAARAVDDASADRLPSRPPRSQHRAGASRLAAGEDDIHRAGVDVIL